MAETSGPPGPPVAEQTSPRTVGSRNIWSPLVINGPHSIMQWDRWWQKLMVPSINIAIAALRVKL